MLVLKKELFLRQRGWLNHMVGLVESFIKSTLKQPLVMFYERLKYLQTTVLDYTKTSKTIQFISFFSFRHYLSF